jgi:hypothetical protein
MKWFRSNIRHGARLALLALVIQFALSFGHSHRFAAQAAPLLTPALTQTTDAAAGDPAARREATRPQSPANQDPDQQPGDNCAICAVVTMAGTALFATPPLLLLPQAVEFLYLATDAEFEHLKSAGRAFQPRAPPAS